jgi:NAD(P)-dependent dehydrogenase (short-subunit alcohol dehydrogenase family)
MPVRALGYEADVDPSNENQNDREPKRSRGRGMRRFENKTAVVTGATGDIGRATVLRLASEGARVLCVGRDSDALAKTVCSTEGLGATVASFCADVTEPQEVSASIAAAQDLGGGSLHAYFNNAGVLGPAQPIEGYDEYEFKEVMDVNVRGVFLGLKYAGAVMAPGGSILNAASVAGLIGFPGFSAYVASKHAVIGLTRSAALELAPRGIRVNAIAPGPVEGRMMTSLESQAGPGSGDAILATVPLGRYAHPDEIARTAAYLLSDDASFVTGAVLSADGGLTTH